MLQNDDNTTKKSDLEQVYEVMTAEGVEFIVIGGQAEIVGLDVLGYVEPIGGYDDLLRHAEIYTILDGQEVRTIGLDDLIRIKTTIKRFKDTESMFQLLAIKRIRDEHQDQ